MDMPHDVEAEKAVLGSIALSPGSLDQINLRPDEFYSAANSIVMHAMLAMRDSGSSIDSVTLAHRLDLTGQLHDVGGLVYLVELLEAVPHSRHINHYAAIVREKAQRRAVIGACDSGTLAAQNSKDVEGAIGQLESELLNVREGACDDGIFSMASAVDLLEEREQNPVAIHSTGLSSLDVQLRGGFRDGQLIVVGGRPGGGKSVFAGQAALAFAQRGEPALIVSLEMDRGELAERFDQVSDRESLRKLPLHMVETAFEASRIAATMRLAKRKYGIKLAVLDYLQLTETTGTRDTRERQIAEVSRLMKRLAAELRIPIVACCQLNRGSDREQREPRLSDLRESGAIEQDADVVLLLHRSNEDDSAKCIVAKHRNGATGIIDLNFHGSEFRFEDATPDLSQFSFASDLVL